MAKYTILQIEDVLQLVGNYGLQLNSFQSMEGGEGNSSFLLNTQQGKFVLTVYDGKDFEDVPWLAETLVYLKKNKFFTNQVIPRLDGELVSEYSEKPVLLKPYIKGQVHRDLSEKMLHQVGVEMAKLHAVPPPDFLKDQHPYGRNLFHTVVGKGIDPKYETWLAEKDLYFAEHIPEMLPRGMIHADLFYDNVLFENNNLVAIIDFEEACNFFLVFDIGMGILGLCWEKETVSLEKARAFVGGYLTVRTLEGIEKQALQIFVEYAAVATSFWRFWNYNIHIPTPEKQNLHWELAKVADNVKDFPPSEFLRLIFTKP